MDNRTTSAAFIALLIAIFLIIALRSFAHYPPVWPDEAIFSDPAVNIVKNGTPGTNLYGPLIPGMQKHSYWMPPGYMLMLASVFSVTEISLTAVRMLTLSMAILTLILTYRIGRSIELPRLIAWTAPTLLVVDTVFLRGSLFGRMDMAAIVFILTGLLLFISSHRPKALLASGLSGGLALMMHPIGGVGAMATGIAALIRGRKSLLFYTCAFMIPVIAWGLYIILDIESFKSQFLGQFIRKETFSSGVPLQQLVLVNLAQYGPQTSRLWAAGLFYFAGTSGLLLHAIRKPRSGLVLATQIFLAAAVIKGYELGYQIYLVPLNAVGIACLVATLLESRRFRLGVAPLFLLCLVQGYLSMEWSNSKVPRGASITDLDHRYLDWASSVDHLLPQQATVLTTGIPDPYFALIKRTDLHLRALPPRAYPIDESKISKYFREIDYIVSVGRPDQRVASFVEHRGQLVGIGTEGQWFSAKPLQVYRIKK